MRVQSTWRPSARRRAILGVALLVASCALAAQTAAPRLAVPTQAGRPGLQLPPRDAPQRQPSVTRSGSIQGRVLRADTGAPIPRATVILTGAGGSPTEQPIATTDERGVYQFHNLRTDKYTVRASKTGFVTTSYGQRGVVSNSGMPLDLAERQALTRIDITLPVGAVIEGRVFDEYGEPVAGAIVQTARRSYFNGERRLSADTATTSITDDLGRFRLYGIPAGARYVSATTNAPTAPRPTLLIGVTGSAAPTYYPGTTSVAEAMPITVAAGQEVSGIAFQMSSPQMATLSGTVRAASGQGVGPAQLMLSASNSSRGGTVRPDGTFAFANLAPGPYTLIVRFNDLSEVAYVPVTLAGVDVSLSIVTGRGATIKGRLVFDEGAPPTGLRPENMSVAVQSAESVMTSLATGSSRINEDWTFQLPGVVGRGVLRVLPSTRSATQPEPWKLKAVVRNGVDITDAPMTFIGDIDDVEMVITQRISVITGTLTGGKNEPVRDAMVIVFAEDPQRWVGRSRYILASRPDAMGQFTVRGLPPGRYLAIAVNDLESGDEQDPEILETLRRKATALTLGEGESKSLNLKLRVDSSR